MIDASLTLFKNLFERQDKRKAASFLGANRKFVQTLLPDSTNSEPGNGYIFEIIPARFSMSSGVFRFVNMFPPGSNFPRTAGGISSILRPG